MASSTFFGLHIAGSGLRAANAALNTTANNIANTETEGYSRQQVQQKATDALRTFTTYGCAGGGVDTLAIERVRDSFYDVKFRENEARLGEQERKAYYMAVVENYFTDDGTTGFKTIFDDMTESLQELSKNPSSSSTKAQFISSMKTLTDYFNNMYGDLQDLQGDINDELKTQVDQINSIAQEIATMNKQINVIEMTGSIANELRDQRDVLIDKLSKIVDVKTKETPVYDIYGNDTGATRFMVSIAGGQPLVDQNEFRQIETKARMSYEKVNQTDIQGLYEFYWNDGTLFNLDNAAMQGSLKGLADLRDGNNGENFRGTLKGIGAVTKDGVSYQTAVVQTTESFLADMSKCNLSDTGGTITIKNQIYYFDSWSFEKNDDGTANYTFVLSKEHNELPLDGDKINMPSTIGSTTKYQGIPYYMEQMNEWIRDFSNAVNKIFTEGYDAKGNEAGILLSGNKATDDAQYTEAELDKDNSQGKGYYFLTAGNFSVMEELMLNADRLGVRKDPAAGVEEGEKVKEMIDMISNKDKFTFRGNDASGFLENIISDAALNASNANVFSSTYQTLQNIIKNQKTSISGVDQDEEAVNLVKYQNAYTLASKMISTLTEIYDRLILETGV